jgi:SRSO17 transposase
MTIAALAGAELDSTRAFEEVKQRLGVLFGRVEQRRGAISYMDGLLSRIERKTGWQLTERRSRALAQSGRPGTRMLRRRAIWLLKQNRALRIRYIFQ